MQPPRPFGTALAALPSVSLPAGEHGVALLLMADEALTEGARAAQGTVGGRMAVKMRTGGVGRGDGRSDLRSLLPHLIFTNGRHCALNDHDAADALRLWASSADVAPAAEAHTMAILGALARMRVGPPHNGREPATEGCTRVPTGAGRSTDESGMLGPDAFKHDSRELAAADKKADGHRAHCAGECGMLGLSLGWLFRGYLVSLAVPRLPRFS